MTTALRAGAALVAALALGASTSACKQTTDSGASPSRASVSATRYATPRPSRTSPSAPTTPATSRSSGPSATDPSADGTGQDSQAQGGHGTGGRASRPAGVSLDQWQGSWKNAGKAVKNYWEARQRWEKPYGRWTASTAKYSTPAMIAADRQYLDSYEFHKTAKQLDQEQMHCSGNSWPIDSWITDREPATPTQFTLAMPVRQECYWADENNPEMQKRRHLYNTSQGRDGYNVRIVAFRVKKLDGQWKVDKWDHIDLPQGADPD